MYFKNITFEVFGVLQKTATIKKDCIRPKTLEINISPKKAPLNKNIVH